jgi:hypothetical protein
MECAGDERRGGETSDERIGRGGGAMAGAISPGRRGVRKRGRPMIRPPPSLRPPHAVILKNLHEAIQPHLDGPAAGQENPGPACECNMPPSAPHSDSGGTSGSRGMTSGAPRGQAVPDAARHPLIPGVEKPQMFLQTHTVILRERTPEPSWPQELARDRRIFVGSRRTRPPGVVCVPWSCRQGPSIARKHLWGLWFRAALPE